MNYSALFFVGLVLFSGCANPIGDPKVDLPAGVFAQITTENGKAFCLPDSNVTIQCYYSDYAKVKVSMDQNGVTQSVACGQCVEKLDLKLFGE